MHCSPGLTCIDHVTDHVLIMFGVTHWSCSQKSPTHRHRPPFGSGAFSSFLHSSPWPLWSGPRFNTQPYGWWDERFIPGNNSYRVLEGAGKGQSRREATGSEKAPASPFGQPSTKIGQPRGGPLASCASVRCPYRASGGTGLGQSRGEQGQVEHPTSLHLIVHCLWPQYFQQWRLPHLHIQGQCLIQYFGGGKNPLPNTWLHFAI